MIPLMMGCCAQKFTAHVFPDDYTDMTVNVLSVGGSGARIDVFSEDAALMIDWGDGSPIEYSGGGYFEAAHDYASVGEFNLRIYFEPSLLEIFVGGGALASVNSWQSDLQRFSFGSSSPFTVPDYIPDSMKSIQGMFRGCSGFNDPNVVYWHTANLENMDGAYNDASAFNQNLSGWCVPNILSEPPDFSAGASSWVLPKPVWGTCPGA